MATTTTKNGFPVIDVTHRPKRTQADNLRKAGVLEETEVDTPIVSKVPQSPTVEGAIQFFKDNAKGEFAKLYNNTAVWLTHFLEMKSKERRRDVKVEVTTESEGVENETTKTESGV